MTIQQSIPAPAPPEATPAADANSRVTPMMEQYLEIKAAHPGLLLFYRMGDFYELFFEDAEKAAAALGITLTARGNHGGAPIPMCGVPVHAAEAYLAKLIRAGFKVGLDQQRLARTDYVDVQISLDGATAEEISKIFTEVIIAPDADHRPASQLEVSACDGCSDVTAASRAGSSTAISARSWSRVMAAAGPASRGRRGIRAGPRSP